MDITLTLNSGAILRLNSARRVGNYIEGFLSGSGESHMVHDDDYRSAEPITA